MPVSLSVDRIAHRHVSNPPRPVSGTGSQSRQYRPRSAFRISTKIGSGRRRLGHTDRRIYGRRNRLLPAAQYGPTGHYDHSVANTPDPGAPSYSHSCGQPCQPVSAYTRLIFAFACLTAQDAKQCHSAAPAQYHGLCIGWMALPTPLGPCRQGLRCSRYDTIQPRRAPDDRLGGRYRNPDQHAVSGVWTRIDRAVYRHRKRAHNMPRVPTVDDRHTFALGMVFSAGWPLYRRGPYRVMRDAMLISTAGYLVLLAPLRQS